MNQVSHSETKINLKFLNVNTPLSTGSVLTVGLISGFRHGANDIFDILGFCAAHIFIWLPTFRDNLSISSSWATCPLKMGPDRSFRNFGTQLPVYTTSHLRRAKSFIKFFTEVVPKLRYTTTNLHHVTSQKSEELYKVLLLRSFRNFGKQLPICTTSHLRRAKSLIKFFFLQIVRK